MKKVIFLIAIFFLLLGIAKGQSTFSKIYELGSSASVITSIYPTDSCIYAIGIIIENNNVGNAFLKLDYEGEVLLQKNLSDSLKSYEFWRGTLQPTHDGYLTAVGYSIDTSEMTNFLIKLNTNGDTLFSSESVSPSHQENPFYIPKDMIIDSISNDFVIINRLADTINYTNTELLIRDQYGNVKRSKIYGNEMHEVGESIIQDDDGGYIIGIWKSNINLTTLDFISQTQILKVDTLGDIIWEYLSSLDKQEYGGNAILKTNDNGLIVATGIGQEVFVNPSTNNLYFDLYIYKLDENQNVEWEIDYSSLDTGLSDFTRFYKILDVGNGFVAAGTNVDGEFPSIEDGYLVKVSPDGERLWERKFHIVENVIAQHQFYDLRQTPDGGFIMSGQINDFGQLNIGQSGWLVKVDQHGCLVPGCHLPNANSNIPVNQPTIKIYPNPTSDILNIFFSEQNHSKNGIFRLVDLQGSIVLEFDANKNDATYIVSLEKYPSGIYFLQYIQEGILMESEKVVIQK